MIFYRFFYEIIRETIDLLSNEKRLTHKLIRETIKSKIKEKKIVTSQQAKTFFENEYAEYPIENNNISTANKILHKELEKSFESMYKFICIRLFMHKRIVSNIIHLDKLYRKPCNKWLSLFVNGQLDANKAFKKYEQQYDWLYYHSPYDLIRWEIENNVFDWDKHSYFVAKYHPELIDKKKFNWKCHSYALAIYCPEKIIPRKYNWKKFGKDIIIYCPDKIDPDRYEITNKL